jgi:uncharacterized protein YecT (DUF1311 family)
MHRCLLLLATALALPIAAQELPPSCDAPMRHALPAADQPNAADRARLATCDSESLYYADAPDHADARLCAWLEREDGNELVIGGSAVLMMLYANGLGVERDLALAQRFACETGGAPAELDGRLEHLQQMAAQADPPRDFDLCDDITSGYMMGFCAERDAGLRRRVREREWEALLAGWSEAERAAWKPLRAAAEGFFEARVQGEVDMGGTARGAMAIGTAEELEETLLKDVTAFEQGTLPTGDAAALKAADAALNASYAAARRAATPDAGEDWSLLGTIRPEGIRDAERAWLKYRDAWVAFGKVKYPGVPAEAWLDYYTRQREAQLREMGGVE